MSGSKPLPWRGSLTMGSLAALACGLVLGTVGHRSGANIFPAASAMVQPLGQLWVSGLQALVLPLVVTQLLAAFTGLGGPDGRGIGGIGVRALALFVGLLLVGGVLTILIGPAVIGLYGVDPAMVERMSASTVIPEAAHRASTAGPGSFGAWVGALIPSNLFEAASAGDILPLLIFSAFFGAAATRLPEEQQKPLSRLLQALAATMLVLVGWVLRFTPVGVFIFTFTFAVGTGGGAVGFLGAFVASQVVLMLLVTALFYPVASMVGRVPLLAFAKALVPAQIVAVSTRSSLAALPALVTGAREQLGLPATATGFVLPFSASLFKMNRTVSSTAKLLFMGHVYGVELGAATLAGFVLTIILLSFSSVGIPGGGSAFRSLPVYLAAGIPIEAIVILEAADAIPDIFKTLLNVTGDMSVAVLLIPSATPESAVALEGGLQGSLAGAPVGVIGYGPMGGPPG